MKLEISKNYKRRDGQLETIIRFFPDKKAFLSGKGNWYTPKGKCFYWKDTQRELVAEMPRY